MTRRKTVFCFQVMPFHDIISVYETSLAHSSFFCSSWKASNVWFWKTSIVFRGKMCVAQKGLLHVIATEVPFTALL